MIKIKTKEEIEKLKEGGKLLAQVLREASAKVAPGVSTDAINDFVDHRMREFGGTPAFLGYQPRGARRPFPGAVCISVNEEIVHGIPNEDPRVLKEGDIVSLDAGLTYHGLITDSAVSVIAGVGDEKARKLLNVTREALMVGIKAAQPGKRTGDIGHAIETFVKQYEYSFPVELGGHGVGHKVHEDPNIPNYGNEGEGEELVVGMVIALEPMLHEGKADIEVLPDDYTIVTKDGSRSAHFEHTVAITENGPEILTKE
ncbi:MAG: type I methionyl aminopeptidase [Candidatus Paceibacterota bacterium]